MQHVGATRPPLKPQKQAPGDRSALPRPPAPLAGDMTSGGRSKLGVRGYLFLRKDPLQET